MRGKLTLAVLASILLIGSASWSRFISTDKAQPSLAVIEKNLGLTDEEILSTMMQPSTASSTTAQADLSDTDKLGRQLITDYVALAASGEASDESLDALANKYVDIIPQLTSAPHINRANLKIVDDTKANFQNYADALTKIYKDYSKKMKELQSTHEAPSALNPALYSTTSLMGDIYEDAAQKLKGISVPDSLSFSHLKLVNSYLLNAEAMKSISLAETDSAKSFAGLIALSGNVDNEQSILSEISQILTAHGL